MRVICEHTGGFIGRRSCSELGRSAGFCTQAVEKNLWPRELPETPAGAVHGPQRFTQSDIESV